MMDRDAERRDASGDEGLEEKVVPVSEAIRYRKRAQSAERTAAEREQRLAEVEAENARLRRQVEEVRLEQEVSAALRAAGASDLETATLVARRRLEGREDCDVQAVVEELRKEKAHLFGASAESAATVKTAGVKLREGGGRNVLERAAQRAAASGSRADVQEYLRARRTTVR